MIAANNPKAGLSVSDMARQCSLSRSRFHQLIGDAFPYPVYDVATRRPFYTEELQQVCLEVRRRNFGINGRAVLFYSPRQRLKPTAPRRSTTKRTPPMYNPHEDLVAGLRGLGIATITPAEVAAAVKELYPNGANGTDQGEVLRAVFLHMRVQGSTR